MTFDKYDQALQIPKTDHHKKELEELFENYQEMEKDEFEEMAIEKENDYKAKQMNLHFVDNGPLTIASVQRDLQERIKVGKLHMPNKENYKLCDIKNKSI